MSALASSVLLAGEVSQDQVALEAQISQVKSQMATLDAQLQGLKAKRPPNEAIVTHTELGYVQTNGNTETKTFNLESNIQKGWNKHLLSFLFDAQYASDNGVESKNKYFMELNYNYNFTDRFAFGYLTGYKNDKFSAFEYQFYTGPGAQYKILNTDRQSLDVDGNILYSIDKDRVSKKENNYSSYRLKAFYGIKLMDSVDFSQEVTYRSSFDSTSNYFIFSKTALTSKLTDIFSAGLSYKVDYVNEPMGKERTDRTITANLIIDY
jgi:putative salt-induced outer membrane protein